MKWMIEPFRRYFQKSGRSTRREFWGFSLLNLIVTFVTLGAAVAVSPATTNTTTQGPEGFNFSYSSQFTDSVAGTVFASIYGLYIAASFIPSVMVTIRRLHDRGATGWWALVFPALFLVPLFGLLSPIAFVIVMALPGNQGPNRFGPDPRDPFEEEIFA